MSDDNRHLNKRQCRMIQEIGRAMRERGEFRGILFDLDGDTLPPTPPRPPVRDRLLAAASWLLVIGLVMGLMGLFASLALGAPAPAYREPPHGLRDRLLGDWSAEWFGEAGGCRFSPDGSWGLATDQGRFEGTWALDGRSLLIRQKQVANCDPDADWPCGCGYETWSWFDLADERGGFSAGGLTLRRQATTRSR